MRLCAVILVACVVLAASANAQAPYYQSAMVAVHSHFTGTPGAVARFGDSITYSGAFFKPLKWTTFTGGTTQDQQALTWFQGYVNSACLTWQDDAVASSDGNYSGTTSTWPVTLNNQFPGKTNIAGWLDKLKPEMAVIMWGSNDLASVSLIQYKANMRVVVQTCMDKGTIPILTTIPPRVGYTSTYPTYAQAMRDLATEMNVPLIEYNQGILDRRPGTTWQNTLISSDGTHPTALGGSSFSATALTNDGYLLRNYLTLNAMYDVRNNVLVPEPASLSLLALGGLAMLRRRK